MLAKVVPSINKRSSRIPEGETVLRNPLKSPDGDGEIAAGNDAFEAGVLSLLADAAAHYRNTLRKSPDAIRYLGRRGISGAIAARFGIGFSRQAWKDMAGVLAGYDEATVLASGLAVTKSAVGDGIPSRLDRFRGRIMFPIRDRAGRIVGFGGRVTDETTPKYLNSPEGPVFKKRNLLYGLYEAYPAILKAGEVTVVEGYVDVVSLHQYGFDTAVAALGTACSADQIAELRAIVPNLVFCFDGNKAGRLAAERALEKALPFAQDETIRFAFLPEGQDPDSFVREHGPDAFRQCLAGAMSLYDFLIQVITSGCELRYAEGRSKCSVQGRRAWQCLPAGDVKDKVLTHCAELLELSDQEMLDHWLSY